MSGPILMTPHGAIAAPNYPSLNVSLLSPVEVPGFFGQELQITVRTVDETGVSAPVATEYYIVLNCEFPYDGCGCK